MKSWYRLRNRSALMTPRAADDDSPRIADIDLLDEIGFWGVTAEDFIRDVRGLGDLDEIHLHIHSPGGSVFDGLAIYNFLRAHKATVQVDVLGLAASMASVIAMVGDTVTMPANAYLMVHNVSGGAYGESKDMRKTADLIDQLGETIVGIYSRREAVDADTIRQLMADETWITAARALELGLIDEVTDAIEAAAAVSMSRFDPDKVPSALAQAMGLQAPPPPAPPAPPAEDPPPANNADDPDPPAPAADADPTLGDRLLGWFGMRRQSGVATPPESAPPPPDASAEPVAQLQARVDDLTGQLASAIQERDDARREVDSIQTAMTAIEDRLQNFDGAVRVQTLQDLAALGVPITEVVPPAADPDAAAASDDEMTAEQIEAELKKLEAENATERDGAAVMKRARRMSQLRTRLDDLQRDAAA